VDSISPPIVRDIGVQRVYLVCRKIDPIPVVNPSAESNPIVTYQCRTDSRDETRTTILEAPSKELAAIGVGTTEAGGLLDLVDR
jgi:hypothetical protein